MSFLCETVIVENKQLKLVPRSCDVMTGDLTDCRDLWRSTSSTPDQSWTGSRRPVSEGKVRSLQLHLETQPDHQHVQDEAAPEDGGVAAPPLWRHELAVQVEYWGWLRDLDTGVASATHY